MKRSHLLFFSIFFMLLFTGCRQDSDNGADTDQLQGEGIEVDGAWARPAAEGRMSAAYFLITNYGEDSETLESIESDVAQNAEMHESYEREEGMVGMRAVEDLEIPSKSTIRFEQGGFHVMLVELTRNLSEGDTFNLTLNFQDSDSIIIEVPVEM